MNRKLAWVAALSIAGLALAGCASERPDPEVEAALTRHEMPRAAKELNCMACHALDHRVVGPAWLEVAKRYRGGDWFVYNNQGYPLVEGLVMKVSRGGSGHWGSMPMPANDPSGAKRDKIEHLVRFILKLDGAHPAGATSSGPRPPFPEEPPNVDPAPNAETAP